MVTRSCRLALLAALLIFPSLARAQDPPMFTRPPEPDYRLVNAKLADDLEQHGRIYRNIGAILVPVGVAGAAVSFVASWLGMLNECAPGSACEHDANVQVIAGTVGMIAGAATVVVGGILLGKGLHQIREARAMRMGLSPLVSSREMGLHFRLEF
jgi:hypothetical protein